MLNFRAFPALHINAIPATHATPAAPPAGSRGQQARHGRGRPDVLGEESEGIRAPGNYFPERDAKKRPVPVVFTALRPVAGIFAGA